MAPPMSTRANEYDDKWLLLTIADKGRQLEISRIRAAAAAKAIPPAIREEKRQDYLAFRNSLQASKIKRPGAKLPDSSTLRDRILEPQKASDRIRKLSGSTKASSVQQAKGSSARTISVGNTDDNKDVNLLASGCPAPSRILTTLPIKCKISRCFRCEKHSRRPVYASYLRGLSPQL
ncbi:hypothetical protein EV356DRAFT_499422 [Viridothelium virens]|uniref:Uncharacterized protein n=1 Tax=Viridothelium virens TaxID=1048519 RepID=A0A6A6HCK8_VIRVR|nr:hypothetical protein EV356DRAFT_499422 [Viridothelium virens]